MRCMVVHANFLRGYVSLLVRVYRSTVRKGDTVVDATAGIATTRSLCLRWWPMIVGEGCLWDGHPRYRDSSTSSVRKVAVDSHEVCS